MVQMSRAQLHHGLHQSYSPWYIRSASQILRARVLSSLC